MGVGPLRTKAVFLDRDGVLNRAKLRNGRPYPPASLEELEILPGVPEALRVLRKMGFLLIVVTNQPDVERGKQEKEIVEEINVYLHKKLDLDELYVCWHGKDDECNCRKPLPGLLLKAAQEWNIDLGRSYMVGDRWRDIDAGNAAGCRTVFIDRNYQEQLRRTPDTRLDDLVDAVGWIRQDMV